MTYALIQRTALTSSVASVNFSNIPQNFRSLRLEFSARSDFAAPAPQNVRMFIRPNGLTTNLNTITLLGNGATASGATGTDGRIASISQANDSSDIFGTAIVVMNNYNDTQNYKTIGGYSATENQSTTAYITLDSLRWSSLNPITSFTLVPSNGNLISGSIFNLYGII